MNARASCFLFDHSLFIVDTDFDPRETSMLRLSRGHHPSRSQEIDEEELLDELEDEDLDYEHFRR